MSTNKDPEETIRQLESRLQKLEKERRDERAIQKGKEEQASDAQLLGYVIGAPIKPRHGGFTDLGSDDD